MKTFILCLLIVQTLSANDLNLMVQNEFQITQNEAKTTLNDATERLAFLKKLKEKAVFESKKVGTAELNGKNLMDKYAALLLAKYHNKQDEFEAGFVISEKDQFNINRLFQGYLASQPLKDQTSAGEAKRILEIGSKALEEKSKAHLNPSEKNNSQLEILEYQVQNAEAVLKKATNLAAALGIGTKSGTAPVNSRKPASKE